MSDKISDQSLSDLITGERSPSPEPDDLSGSFQLHRTQLAQATAAEELLMRVKSAPKKEGSPAAPATAPATPDGEGNIAGRVAKDVGLGLTVEVPRAVVSGVRDAYQNTLDLAKDVGDYVEQKLDLPVLMIDKRGVRFTSNEEAAGHRLSDLATLPKIKGPSTVTGSIIKGVAQFLTGMKGAGKLMDVAGLPKLAGAAQYTKAALQGAVANFTVFDPQQQRLSNLIEQFPALGNPVTEFLQSKQDDTKAEGRFKNSLEGLGLGVLADGFFKGVKLLRQVSQAKAAAEPVAETVPGLANDAFKELGDSADNRLIIPASEKPSSALLLDVPLKKQSTGLLSALEKHAKKLNDYSVTPEEMPAKASGQDLYDFAVELFGSQEKAKKYFADAGIDLKTSATMPKEGGNLFINFARIESPDDVKAVMQDMANRAKPGIDEARRGTRSFEVTKLDAQQLDAWKILSARRIGEPLNAEQSVAARQLWVSASDRLTSLAQMAADAPSEANLFAFRKMVAVHDAVQREVIAARTETARALGSWRIPVGSAAERLRDVTGVIEATGGMEASRELAKRIAALSRAGMTSELNAVVEHTAGATTGDAILEGWINGLLSNPATHVVNTTSNASVLFLRMGERATAARIAGLFGDDASVQAGEAAGQWFGMVSGIKDGFRYAAKAARTGESGMGLGKIEMPHPGAFGAEAFGLSQSGWLGRGADLLGEYAVRLPGKALIAEDEFFKTLGYRMELNAQALRQASTELNAGKLAESGFKARIAEIVANPPENIRMAAVDAATYQTFTQTPGKLAQSLGRLTQHYPALKVILPFTRTPANILSFTFERTPLAPLMGTFRANIAAGGPRRDLALAQMGLGTMAMMSFADMTMNNQVTGRGPVEKGQREALQRTGWQPYSLKIGDRWFSYNRLDPVGSLIGMSADATETLMHAQHEVLDDPDIERVAVAATIAFAGNLVNKSYLSGLSSVIEALNDPTRSAESWSRRLVGSLIPAGVAAVGRVDDPQVREVNSMIDALRARTPGLSDNLPPKRDLWGAPIDRSSGYGKAFDLLSPSYTKAPNVEPIDKEIVEQGFNVTMPSRKTSFNGVTVDLSQYPKAYSRYVELAGNELKHPAWNLGAKDFLNAVVTGKHPMSAVYQLRSDGPDGGKDVFIRDTISKYRDMARTQLLKEFPDLARDVADKQVKARELRMPVLRQ